MATPRKEYPSDHRRYFRVNEDILDDPKLAECTASECWLFVGLLAMLNRMKSRDGIVTIPVRTVNSIARVRDWSTTQARLNSLQSAACLSYVRSGKSLTLCVPKWPKNQGFTPAELRPDSGGTPLPSPTPSPTPKNKENAPISTLVKDQPRREKKTSTKSPATPWPEDTTELEARVREWVRRKHPNMSHHSVPSMLERVGAWARSKDKRMVDWYAAVQGYCIEGWAWAEAKTQGAPDPPSARRGYHKPFNPDEQARLIEGDVAALTGRLRETGS